MKIIKKIKELIKEEGLFGRSIRGGAVLTLGNTVENLSRFIRNMILARLLAPEAFGLMATVMAAVAALEAMAEVGLRQSVIQNKRGAEEGFLNITWWLSSLRGITLYICAFLAAPLIADFFNKPDAITELRIGFLVIMINGLVNPRLHVLEKQMRFWNWAVIIQGAAFSGIMVAIISAFLIRSVWALIFGYITEAFLRLIMSFAFYPFLPRLKFDRAYLRDIMRFSRGMFGLPILTMLYMQTDIFVIGKVISLDLLGMYVLARSIAEIPVTIISKVVNRVLLPAFSSMQDNKDRLGNTLLDVTRAASIFGMSLISSLIIFSKPILTFAYGAEYSQVSIPFSFLCIYSFILMCAQINMEMYLAIGKPGIHRTASLVRIIIFLSLIYPITKYYGLVGVSILVVITMLIAYIIQLIYVRKILAIGIMRYFKTWGPAIKLSASVVVIPGVIFSLYFERYVIVSIGVGVGLGLIAWMLGVKKLGLLKDRARISARDISEIGGNEIRKVEHMKEGMGGRVNKSNGTAESK